MAAPTETVPGCPPGLEYLTQVDQLLVNQQVELFESELPSLVSVATGAECMSLMTYHHVILMYIMSSLPRVTRAHAREIIVRGRFQVKRNNYFTRMCTRNTGKAWVPRLHHVNLVS